MKETKKTAPSDTPSDTTMEVMKEAPLSDIIAADIPETVMRATTAPIELTGSNPTNIICAYNVATRSINAGIATVVKDSTVPPGLQAKLTGQRVPSELKRSPESVTAELANGWARSPQLFKQTADVLAGLNVDDFVRLGQVSAIAGVDVLVATVCDKAVPPGVIEPLRTALAAVGSEGPTADTIAALERGLEALVSHEGHHSQHILPTVNASTEFIRKVLRAFLDVKPGSPQDRERFASMLATLQGNVGNWASHKKEGNYDEEDHFQAEINHPTKGFRALMALFMAPLRRMDLNIKHDDECRAEIEADKKRVAAVGSLDASKLRTADRQLADDEKRRKEADKTANAERKAKTAKIYSRRELQRKLMAAIKRRRDQSANGPTNAKVADPKGVDFIFGPQIKPGLKNSLKAELRALGVEHAANNDMQTQENEYAQYIAAFQVAGEIAKNHDQSIGAVRSFIKTDQEVLALLIKATETVAALFKRAYVTRRSAELEAPGSEISSTKCVAEFERLCKAVADIGIRQLEKTVAIAENNKNHASTRLRECEEARMIVQNTTMCPEKKRQAKEAVAAAEAELAAAGALLVAAVADRDGWLDDCCYDELVARRLSRNSDDPDGKDIRSQVKAQRDEENKAFMEKIKKIRWPGKNWMSSLGWK